MRPPLVRALDIAGIDEVDVAARLGVDPKTVQRWLTGRIPFPRHRAALAELTGWAEDDLWPPAPSGDADSDELRVAFARRSDVPSDAWRRFFSRAKHDIGIVVYSGLFLAEDAGVQQVLRERARRGVRVRVALGDPESGHVVRRGDDEGIGAAMASKIQNAIALYRPLLAEPTVELRVHEKILYTSIYRSDDELMVNQHIYGRPASQSPVLHLQRRRSDGPAAAYLETLDRVWCAASQNFPA
jgi:hypothetical protein